MSDRKEDVDRGPLFDPQCPARVPTQEFLDACGEAGIVLEQAELHALGRYLGFLADATTRINLTAVTEDAAMWMRHIFDALTLVPVIASIERKPGAPTSRQRLIDVGSGGGVPGIPLAIVLPDVDVTLLEATGKKVRFLRETCEALGLTHVTTLQARAEDAARDRERHREQYDVVVSRAVGPLPTLLELTVPFARVGGLVLAIKGMKAEAEIAEAQGALRELGASVFESVVTPTGTVVPIKKNKATSRMYPRRAGEPKRVPIR